MPLYIFLEKSDWSQCSPLLCCPPSEACLIFLYFNVFLFIPFSISRTYLQLSSSTILPEDSGKLNISPTPKPKSCQSRCVSGTTFYILVATGSFTANGITAAFTSPKRNAPLSRDPRKRGHVLLALSVPGRRRGKDRRKRKQTKRNQKEVTA